MSNWRLAPQDRPRALPGRTVQALRELPVTGLSRRELLRRALGAGLAVWLMEMIGGTIAFAWPSLSHGFGGSVTIGDIDKANAHPAAGGPGADFGQGAPAYFQEARAFIVLIDPELGFIPGASPLGDGRSTNVRTLYQRCTHLGCKPNFCPRNFWFECPCHGSRYDRLGIKVASLGPAPRGLDRFASVVDSNRVLTIDTGKITLGPLPIALGQPGVIPPKSPTGCL